MSEGEHRPGGRVVADGHGSLRPSVARALLDGAVRRWWAASPAAMWRWLQRQLEHEERALTSFHAVPLGLMLGIALLYAADPATPPLAAIPCLLVGLAGLFVSRTRPAWHLLAVLAASAAAGATLAAIEIARSDTTVLSGGAITRIDGHVEWRETDERNRIRYLVRVGSTTQPTLSRPPERARILVAARHDPIPIGGRFAALVRLSPPSGPALPGAYDFAFAPFFGGVGAIGFALGAPRPPAADAQPSADWNERLAALRLRIAEHIRASIGGAEGAVAAALVTGVRAGIPNAVEDDLRATGLAHVLSISGYHMALVAGFAMFGLRAALAAVPAIALNWPVKKIAAAAALAVSAAYLALAGDNVATDRSFIMLAIMLTAVMLDRPALTLRNVSVAAIIVLAMQPHALFTASFQMSFAATAALVGLFGAYVRRDRDEAAGQRGGGLAAGLAKAIVALAVASLLAGAATAPFGAYHFGRLAPFGIVANLLLMPVFSLWIMPVALLATLLMPLGLDGPAWQLMGVGLTLVFDLAHRLATALPDAASGTIGVAALILLAAGVLAASICASALRWIAVPLVLAGLAAAAWPTQPPELLIYEDGKEVALVSQDGALRHLDARPSRFVDEQWRRVLGSPPARDNGTTFTCAAGICRAATRSGLRVAWTDMFEKTGELCDTADIAIVARAIRLDECRSGATLVTLRTLRRTGSLAVGRNSAGLVEAQASIAWVDGHPRDPWNAHRAAPWPERWQRPGIGPSGGPSRSGP